MKELKEYTSPELLLIMMVSDVVTASEEGEGEEGELPIQPFY